MNAANQQSLSVTWSARELDARHNTGRALLFLLGNTTYAVSVAFVRRVMELPAVVPVAGAKPWLLGMANCEGVAVPLIHTQHLLHPDSAVSSQTCKRAIVIDCAHGSCLLAVEQINTLSDLSGSQRHAKLPAEYPAPFIEYSCESNGVTIGVIKVATLFQNYSKQAVRTNRDIA